MRREVAPAGAASTRRVRLQFMGALLGSTEDIDTSNNVARILKYQGVYQVDIAKFPVLSRFPPSIFEKFSEWHTTFFNVYTGRHHVTQYCHCPVSMINPLRVDFFF